jgi:hypothetical protein
MSGLIKGITISIIWISTCIAAVITGQAVIFGLAFVDTIIVAVSD